MDDTERATREEYSLIQEFFRTIADELQSQDSPTNEKLDKLVTSLVKEDLHSRTLRKGTILYRARKYTEPDAQKRFSNPPKDRFQGYDKQGSYANLKKLTAGRCNPICFASIYTCETDDCCLAEIDAEAKEYISMAKIEVKKSLKILEIATDCVASFGSNTTMIAGIEDGVIILYLSVFFSQSCEDMGGYQLTQYLSRRIKEAGYDGISFYSSKYNGLSRINYAIFISESPDYVLCEPVSSVLYRITEIHKESAFDSSRGFDSKREMISEFFWETSPQ